MGFRVNVTEETNRNTNVKIEENLKQLTGKSLKELVASGQLLDNFGKPFVTEERTLNPDGDYYSDAEADALGAIRSGNAFFICETDDNVYRPCRLNVAKEEIGFKTEHGVNKSDFAMMLQISDPLTDEEVDQHFQELSQTTDNPVEEPSGLNQLWDSILRFFGSKGTDEMIRYRNYTAGRQDILGGADRIKQQIAKTEKESKSVKKAEKPAESRDAEVEKPEAEQTQAERTHAASAVPGVSMLKEDLMKRGNEAVDILCQRGQDFHQFKQEYWKKSGADARETVKNPKRLDKIIRMGKAYYAQAASVASEIRHGDMDPKQPVSPAPLYQIASAELMRDFYNAGDDTMEKLMETGLGSRGVIAAMREVPEIKKAFDNMTAEKFVKMATNPNFMKFSDEIKEKIKVSAQATREKMIQEGKAAPTRDQKLQNNRVQTNNQIQQNSMQNNA